MHQKNQRWWQLTDAEKEAELTKHLLMGDHREAGAIARDAGISAATATKFLHRLVYAGVAIASPELYRKRTGSTCRTFRLRRKGEHAPDMDDEPADVVGYRADDDNGTRSTRAAGGWSSPAEEEGSVR